MITEPSVFKALTLLKLFETDLGCERAR
jgi:hypothetical protein